MAWAGATAPVQAPASCRRRMRSPTDSSRSSLHSPHTQVKTLFLRELNNVKT